MQEEYFDITPSQREMIETLFDAVYSIGGEVLDEGDTTNGVWYGMYRTVNGDYYSVEIDRECRWSWGLHGEEYYASGYSCQSLHNRIIEN